MSTATWKAIEQLVQARDPHCRGAVILGLNEPLSVLVEQFAQAREVGMVKGFMVGRSVFASASQLWLKGELSDEDMMAQVVANFRVLYQAWRGVD